MNEENCLDAFTHGFYMLYIYYFIVKSAVRPANCIDQHNTYMFRVRTHPCRATCLRAATTSIKHSNCGILLNPTTILRLGTDNISTLMDIYICQISPCMRNYKYTRAYIMILLTS